jgi:uncharacterized protein YbjT (DUF2867 family)
VQSILVTGATGNVGRHLVAELSAVDVGVRLASRSGPASPTGSAVRFDFTEPPTWAAAFTGIDVMFLVRPPALSRVRRDLLPAMAAARALGVRHVVFLSLQGAERNRLVPHAGIEAWLRASGMGWTFVRPSFFVQNLATSSAADIRERDLIIVPAGSGRTSFVDARDVAAVAARAVCDPGAHAGRAWTVTGRRGATYGEVAHLLSADLGRPIRYANPSLPRFLAHARWTLGLPAPMVAVTAAIYTTARLGLAAGVTEDVPAVLNRPATSLASSLHLERAAWLRDPAATTDRTLQPA